MTAIVHYSDLATKTFLVTGASSGIGQAVAIALGQQGANVIITGRNSDRLNDTAQKIKTDTIILPADLREESARSALVNALPKLDGVCHSAGIINPFPIRLLDQQQFDKIFQINAVAPILLTSQLLSKKKLNDHASLVFISSVASDRAMKGGSIYSASKAALEAFSRTITLEHAAKKIRSNCLRPGLVNTPILEKTEQMSNIAGLQKKYDDYKDRYPLGLGSANDISLAALFLLSDASRWVSSSNLVIDGGFSVSI